METCEFTVKSAQTGVVKDGEVVYSEEKTDEEIWDVIKYFPDNAVACRLCLRFEETDALRLMVDSKVTSCEAYLLCGQNGDIREGDSPKAITSAVIEEVRGVSRARIEWPTHHDGIQAIIRHFPWDMKKFTTELHIQLKNELTIILSAKKVKGGRLCQVGFVDNRA